MSHNDDKKERATQRYCNFLCRGVLMSVSVAEAASWRKVYGGSDLILYIDPASIKDKGSSFTVREKWIPVSYQVRAECGIMAAFSPMTIGRQNAEVAYVIQITEYKKNENSSRLIDGAMYDRRGEMLLSLPQTGSNEWNKCAKDGEASRRACKEIRHWR